MQLLAAVSRYFSVKDQPPPLEVQWAVWLAAFSAESMAILLAVRAIGHSRPHDAATTAAHGHSAR